MLTALGKRRMNPQIMKKIVVVIIHSVSLCLRPVMRKKQEEKGITHFCLFCFSSCGR